MRKHYHVTMGLRGCYMPDVNDAVSSKRDALKLAAWYAKQWNEDGSSETLGEMKRVANGVYHSKHNGIWAHLEPCKDGCCND